MASLDKRVARDERIAWQIIEDEAVLVDREEGEVLRLNPIGAEIWKTIDGKRTLTEIIDHVYQTFEVDRKRAQKDVIRFVKKLLRRELVEEPSVEATR